MTELIFSRFKWVKAGSQNEKSQANLAKDSAVGNVSIKKLSNTFYIFANKLAGVWTDT